MNGYRWVSRNDVFGIAVSDSGHRELHTAVAAYVWGLGKNAYSVGRLVRAFTANADTVEHNLRTAAATLVSEGAVAAYESMLRGGPAQTKFMGPAYFTKFLFFIGYQNREVTGLRPLILDKRVATALRQRACLAQKPVTPTGQATSTTDTCRIATIRTLATPKPLRLNYLTRVELLTDIPSPEARCDRSRFFRNLTWWWVSLLSVAGTNHDRRHCV